MFQKQIEPLKKWYFSKNLRVRKILKITAASLAILLFYYALHSFMYESTDDAYLEGHVIPISPRVASHVSQVLVNDNQEVKQGDLLVELDARDFEAHLNIAKAALQAAEAEARETKRDVERYTQLSKTDEISKQQLDAAMLKFETATARVEQAKAQVKQAELQVSYTKITAPENGFVTKKNVEPGAYVQAGQALMAVVGLEKWVVANFKETQLTLMKPGQKVNIKIDTYPGKKWKGRVDSIQRGSGARFSLFPPENATGNFVKVVQRVPVKIIFDTPQDQDSKHPLALGMSVIPDVKVR